MQALNIYIIDTGAQLFKKTNGLSIVFKIAFNKTTAAGVLQKALLTLGNASLLDSKLIIVKMLLQFSIDFSIKIYVLLHQLF